MKRALILCLFFLTSATQCHCAAVFFPPLQPVEAVSPIQNYGNNITSAVDPFANPININYSAINRIEHSLFGRSFETQNISLRLTRIERSLFNTTYPNSTPAQRIDNIISNFNQINKYPNISKNVLTKIENKVFNQSFSQNSPELRIERLEQQIFGTVQSGDINSRYQALVTAAGNYNANPLNTYYPTTTATGGWKGILGNVIGNTLLGNGTMTGFTPPINPSYNSYDNYGANPIYSQSYVPYAGLGSGGMYRGYGVNNGLRGYRYSDGFTNYGSGAGVTILD